MSEEKLFVPENNSPDVMFTVADASTGQTLPLDSGDDLEFYVKPSASTADNDPLVIKLTRDNGDFTLPDLSKMSGSVRIPSSALSEPGIFWYRLDVIKGGLPNGQRRTEKYGPLVIVNV